MTEDYTQEWQLTTVIEGDRFVITGYTAVGKGKLSFSWEFENEGNGTRITQQIKASGEPVEEYPEELRQMEVGAPKGMAKLAEELDRFAKEK